MRPKALPTKVRQAAAHPERPGEECQSAPGAWRPVVDMHRCEGETDCVAVCPYQVFEVRRMDDEAFHALPLLPRFKTWAHKRLKAYTPNEQDCQACGLCVVACPEKAIVLVAVDGAPMEAR